MTLEPVVRLNRDLTQAAKIMSDDEARYLVDAYYIMQEDRKRSGNQINSMEGEPSSVINWLSEQSSVLEDQIKRALDKYTNSKPIGQWMRDQYGIGPVISAGLIAHININKAITVSHIWRFAGLDPTQKWEKGQKRPWNAKLKTLCWKVGQSFMKFSNQDDCFYGKIYRDRKAYEIARNDSGANKELALELSAKFKKTTEAYKHLIDGKLPPAQLDARARRYAVKMFLSHLQTVWWWLEHGNLPEKPFAFNLAGHSHYVFPPHIPDDLRLALEKEYGSQSA